MHYNLTWAIGDLIAGLTVGMVVGELLDAMTEQRGQHLTRVRSSASKHVVRKDCHSPRRGEHAWREMHEAMGADGTRSLQYGLYSSFVGGEPSARLKARML